MKKRLIKLLIPSLSLSLLLLATPLPPVIAALSPEIAAVTPGSWSLVPTPNTTGFVILSPSEITHLAIGKDATTAYSLDSPNSRLFKSTSAGTSWLELTAELRAQGILGNFTGLAIAPDDPSVLAVIEDGKQVYISTDGGKKFTLTGVVPNLPPTLIKDIAISPLYGTSRDIFIGSAALNDGFSNGIVARLTLPLPSIWENLTDPYQIKGWSGGDVTAIAISPNYATDFTILAVASTTDKPGTNDGDTFLNTLNTRNLPLTWNDSKLFPGYPVRIETAATDSPAEGTSHPGPKAGQSGRILTATIALPRDYSGADATRRRLYVAWNSQPQTSGGHAGSPDAYRIDDTTVVRLNTNGGANIPLTSLTYSGTAASGTLWAGEATGSPETASVQVRRTTNPQASPPSWQLSAKPPTGPGNALLSTTPDGKVYVVTSTTITTGRDESALSLSLDGGISFNQLSLIDTEINTATSTFQDVAPSPDAKTIYLITTSPGFDSLWRTTTQGQSWQRILCLPTLTNTAIIRVSPDDPSGKSFYLVETNTAVTGTTPLYFSTDSGQTYQKLIAPLPAVDSAIACPNTLYIVNSAGQVIKSPDGGKTWSRTVDSRVGSARMLTTAPGNYVLVGGSNNGQVSYSPDGGTNFIPLVSLGEGKGSIQVAADIDFATNKTIYAASDTQGEGAYRFVIGTSTAWSQIKRAESYQRLSGLVQHWGIIYASFYWFQPPPPPPYPALLPPTSGAFRSPNPTAPSPSFDTLTSGIPQWSPPPPTPDRPPLPPQFSRLPSALKASDGINLWTIDTTIIVKEGKLIASNALYHLLDPQTPKAVPAPPPAPPPPPKPKKGCGCPGAALPLGLTVMALMAMSWRAPSLNLSLEGRGIRRG